MFGLVFRRIDGGPVRPGLSQDWVSLFAILAAVWLLPNSLYGQDQETGESWQGDGNLIQPRPTDPLGELFVLPDDVSSPSGDRRGDAIVPRLAWSYDFDDPNSPGDFPLRYWIRMTESEDWPGQAFPLWNRSKYDPARPDPTTTIPRVFQIESRGENSGIRLVDGVIPAIPLTDYLVRLSVRTLDMNRSRVLVIARFLDDAGRAIRESEEQSNPINTHGDWETVSVALRGEFPNAAWIQIDLMLAQVEIWRGVHRGGQEVELQDVSSRAQFNDLTVWRLPRIELFATPSNIIVGPDPIQVHYRLQDMARKRMRVRLRVFDISGVLRDTTEFDVDEPAFEGLWEPNVEEFGWYRATLELFEDELEVARAGLEFAYVPRNRRDLTYETNPNEFTTILRTIPSERTTSVLKEILSALGTGRITIPIWDRTLTKRTMKAARNRLVRNIEIASGDGRAIALNVNVLPDALAADLDYDSGRVIDALVYDQEHMPEFIEDFLVRFGQLSEQWLIGSAGDEELAARHDLPAVFAYIDSLVSRFVPQPMVEFPYPGEFEFPDLNKVEESASSIPPTDGLTASVNPRTDSASAGLSVKRRFLRMMPSSVRLDSIKEFLSNGENERAHISVLIDPIDRDVFGAEAAAEDLVKRVVLARESGARQISLMQPWDEVGTLRSKPSPGPAFPVWRTLREMMAGRTAEGRLPLGPGVVATVFADPDRRTGAIALWSNSATEEEREAAIFLGRGLIEQVDQFGNRSRIPFDGKRHHFKVGRKPMFIDGADIRLAIFRARAKLDNDFVEAAAVQDLHELILYNPWPTAIDGSIRLISPESWRFQPRYLTFSIPSGETVQVPLMLTIPMYEIAGKQSIVANIELNTPDHFEIESDFPIELGHQQIVVRPSYSIIPNRNGEDDLVVTTEVTNRGADHVSIRAFSVAPVDSEYSFRYVDIPMLEPGQTTDVAFYYRGGVEALRGRFLRVGFRGIDTPDRLNLRLKIE